ncbi:M15 family metallopeptidase [Brevibacillus dissolubilis]|uniref:M15 family metallopeptidase n=1 Tax=Brevibacillus dissolubilis TaxID=1844116 RepID=UPI00210039A6|nr:M15 family metallopeptidase [Brevibacillus dissolubilis]
MNKKMSLFVLFVICLATAFFVRERGVAQIFQDFKLATSSAQGEDPQVTAAKEAQAQAQSGGASAQATAGLQGTTTQSQTKPATDAANSSAKAPGSTQPATAGNQQTAPGTNTSTTGATKPTASTPTTTTKQPAGTPTPATAKPATTTPTAKILPATNLTGTNVLVNKTYVLPSTYVPKDLVEPKVPFSFSGKSQKKMMRKEAATALEQLFAHAKKSGINIAAVSGYRSYQTQATIFNYNVKTQGREQANKFSAIPGQSEHQTGLAMDISAASIKYGLEQSFGETAEGKWLAQNAVTFGFIMRYPKGKEHITGYSYEPWHFRYVGVEMAKNITDKGLTLEEYLQETQGNIPQQG